MELVPIVSGFTVQWPFNCTHCVQCQKTGLLVDLSILLVQWHGFMNLTTAMNKRNALLHWAHQTNCRAGKIWVPSIYPMVREGNVLEYMKIDHILNCGWSIACFHHKGRGLIPKTDRFFRFFYYTNWFNCVVHLHSHPCILS